MRLRTAIVDGSLVSVLGAMDELTITHRTTVTEDQIDHLGHMNVRFYGVAARAASKATIAELGGGDRRVDPVDLYTRHFHEQLLGAQLAVHSAVLGGSEGSVRLYHELRNVDTDDLAASFVQRLEVSAAGEAGADPASWPAVSGDVRDIPEHGKPRTIRLNLDPMIAAPDLATARARDLAIRAPRPVGAEECDEAGNFRASDSPMLVWGGEPLSADTGPMLHDGPNGEKIGWAAMENRVVVGRLPRVGDRIQSFSATIAVNDKTTHRIMWAYDIDRGDLLISFEVVDLCFDTLARAAMTIPDDLRDKAIARLHPDLAPSDPAAQPS